MDDPQLSIRRSFRHRTHHNGDSGSAEPGTGWTCLGGLELHCPCPVRTFVCHGPAGFIGMPQGANRPYALIPPQVVLRHKWQISETMRLALPFVSSLFFLVETHGQSLPANPVNEPNNKEMRYSELQQEPKIRPPQSIPANRPQPRTSVTAIRDPHCTATAKLR